MTPSKPATPFNRSVYRDFALFALAAVGVGLAISLTLATAVVLAAGNEAGTAKPERAATDPQLQHSQRAGDGAVASLQQPRAGVRVPRHAPG